MRFKEYLGNDEKTYQKLTIGLVKDKSDLDTTVQKVTEKYELADDVCELIDSLNKRLSNVYTGKFKFDFCLKEDINIDKLKIKNKERLLKRFKSEVFKTKDVFAKSKTEMERKISSEG
jgi:hypothetical protein